MTLKRTNSRTDGEGVSSAQQDMARQMRINELKALVQRADYVVDPHLVAEALLRAGGLRLSPAGAHTPSLHGVLKHRGS